MSKLITNTIRHTGASVDALTFDANGNTLIADGEELQIGAGSDLKLYHDGSNSVIKEAGTGDLRIQTASFRLRNEDASEMMISADADGAVYLAHNGSTKFETTADGVSVTGDLRILNDDDYIGLGAGNDLQIRHDGTNSKINNSTGDLYIQTNGNLKIEAQDGGNDMIHAMPTAQVELHYNGNKRFETTDNGVRLIGNGDCYQYIKAGAADGDCGLIFEDSGGNDDAYFRFDTDDSYYQLGIGGNDLIRIKGSSNPDVTINTTATNGGASDGYIVAEYDGSVKPIVKIRNTASSGSNYSMVFIRESTVAGGIYTTTSNTTVYETGSDYRLKENVVDLANGITRVKQLKPRNFNWIVDETNEVVDGFLAHEAQAVVPTAVSGTKDQVNEDGTIKPQGIDHSQLVPLLTAALQEAIAEIDTLKTKVAALEAA